MPSRLNKRQLVLSAVLIVLVALALFLVSRFDLIPIDLEDKRISIGEVTLALMWAALAVLVIRFVGELIFGFAFRLRKDYEAPNIVRNIFSIVAYILVLTYIFSHFFPQVELAALVTTSAVFSVIIGLALQDTLGNFFAGISLHADKPFQVGDVITLDKFTGVVETITWRAVKIRTFMDHVILIDNATVAKQALEVCSQNELNAREIYFSTLYTDPPGRTLRAARDAVRGTPNVSPRRTPEVNLIKLGESGIDFRVKYWLEDYRRYNDTDSVVRQRIWYALRRAKLTFSFPTRTLHIEPRASRSLQRDTPTDFIEQLAAVPLFAPLSTEEVTRLAEGAELHSYTSGESVIRAGDEGSSMFVIHRGMVEVKASDAPNARTIATLKQGDFFGEMALLGGEPRTASVVARDETEVMEIGYEVMRGVLTSNPALVESLSMVIAERRAGLSAGSAEAADVEAESASLIASIRKFFRLR